MAPHGIVSGPLAGHSTPVHGGRPDKHGCNGCIDCCHLPEISVTHEEADTLELIFRHVGEPAERLTIDEDDAHEGWKLMKGPCIFRKQDRPLKAGGCRIYEQRPAACRIFTCTYLHELRRAL